MQASLCYFTTRDAWHGKSREELKTAGISRGEEHMLCSSICTMILYHADMLVNCIDSVIMHIYMLVKHGWINKICF